MSFQQLGLNDALVKATTELGYSSPTAIQSQAIPLILAGKDLLASAQTGTGKTAAFVLPLLQLFSADPATDQRQRRAKRIQALIMVPTRELALQVDNAIQEYGQHLSLRSMAMVGGIDSEAQKQQLIEGIDILVATPGRLLDMLHQRALSFDQVEVLVLDEADRMLDMGFIDAINKIIERLPEQRQNLLFSATLSDRVRSLAKHTLNNPTEITVSANSQNTPKIAEWLITVDKDNKSSLLSHLIKTQKWHQALIFIRTKHGAAKLVSQLEKRGIAAESIHSGRSQANRSQILSDFTSGKIGLLIATGIAARGLDIDNLERVINYDLPDDADDYVHRIGRTGRAGAEGEAISLVSRDDFKRLCAIESRIDHLISRKTIDGFEAVKEVPISKLNFVRKSPGKAPRKPREQQSTARKDTASKQGSYSKNSPQQQGQKNNTKNDAKHRPAIQSPQRESDSTSSKRSDPWGHWRAK